MTPTPGRWPGNCWPSCAGGGPRPVTELRRHTLTATVYRAADANRALTGLLAAGAVRRERETGRLAGDETITSTR